MLQNWKEQRQKLINGEINIVAFVNSVKNTTVFYSTPAGNDRSGKPQLYLLSNKDEDVKYFPVFLSQESCMNWYNSVGRNGFVLLEGELFKMLEMLDSNEMLSKLGVLVALGSDEQVIIPPNIRAEK